MTQRTPSCNGARPSARAQMHSTGAQEADADIAAHATLTVFENGTRVRGALAGQIGGCCGLHAVDDRAV